MKILVVDNEPGSASKLAQMLSQAGWGSPGVAITSDEAVDWVNHNGNIDVLICEVFLQPADGFSLRETLQTYFPKMRAIFVSGYDVSEYSGRMVGCPFLPKPLTSASLSAALRELIGEPPQSPSVSQQPRAVKAVATPKVAAAQPAERELTPDEFVGRKVGGYLIEAKIGVTSCGGIYRATQTSMSRQARLYILTSEQGKNPEEIQRFVNDASVKASVSHPLVFAVYEAGQENGVYFYSCEYVPCRSLREIHEKGGFIDESTALQAMKAASQVLDYFSRNGIAHEPISDTTVLIGPGQQSRIANIAVSQLNDPFDENLERRELGRIVADSLPQGTQGSTLGVRELVEGLGAGTLTYESWPALLESLTALEPKVKPADAYKLDARERAAIRMVEEARNKQRRSILISSGVSLALLAIALGAVYWAFFRPKGAENRIVDRMIEIPAGEFIYQDGKKITLPAFFIDQHEVTIGQYAKFLDFIKKNPSEITKYEHPDQPKDKSHVPKGWADQDLATGPMPGYYTRAKRWGKYHDTPLDVNSPVFGLDWFDAYAYAKWKGRRLPTEEEWEKAARGTKGFLYPWGNDPDNKRVNTGSDFNSNPKQGGEKDGYKRWSPVDALKNDKSPYGVMGMAGNVSEWTATYDTDPMMPGRKNPVIRGGNWKNPEYITTRRVLLLMDLENEEALGFRTASDNPSSQQPTEKK